MSTRSAPPRLVIPCMSAAAMLDGPMAAALVKAGLVAVIPEAGDAAPEVTAVPDAAPADRQAAAARELDHLRRAIAASAARLDAALAECAHLRAEVAALAAAQASLDARLRAPGVAKAAAARRAGNQRRAERALHGVWSLARRHPARALARLRDIDQVGVAPATRRAIRAAIAVAERAGARRATSP
jgi:hypothetical protein